MYVCVCVYVYVYVHVCVRVSLLEHHVCVCVCVCVRVSHVDAARCRQLEEMSQVFASIFGVSNEMFVRPEHRPATDRGNELLCHVSPCTNL